MHSVNVLTICETGMPQNLTYAEECAWLKEWCKTNKASFYSAPREDFCLRRAREVAVREGNTKVVVEDLS